MKVPVVLALLIVVSFAASFDQVKALIRNDQCSITQLQALRPQIRTQIQKLKQVPFLIKKNPDNLLAKAQLLLLVQQAKQVFDQCDISSKVEPVLGDAVKVAGIGFLLASNCFKDVGAVLLISDQIIEDPSDVVNDIVILIFVALLGRQSYADCAQFINYVI